MRTLLLAFAATTVLALSTVLLLSSCRYFGGERIDGSGRIITQQRSPGSFNSLEVSSALEVRLQQDATPSVKVETDDNLQQYVDVYTRGNTLVIENKSGYNLDPTDKIVVYVSAPEWKELEITGASELFGEAPLTGNELQVVASGASKVSLDVNVKKLRSEADGASTLLLKGTATNFSADASGASQIRGLDLQTSEASLDVSGASQAEITAEKELNIEASGASEVRYRGNANINQKSSGASQVEKI